MATRKGWLLSLICAVVWGVGGSPASAAHLDDYNDFAACVLDALGELKACLLEVTQAEQENQPAEQDKHEAEQESRASYPQLY